MPQTIRYDLDSVMPGFFAKFAEALMPEETEPTLSMGRYQVSSYLLNPDHDEMRREIALVGLLRSGLLKRFESSVHAFGNTCRRMAGQHQLLLNAMDQGYVIVKDFYKEIGSSEELDENDFEELLSGSSHTEPLHLFDHKKLRADVENDLAIFRDFAEETDKLSPDLDPKLNALIEELVRVSNQAKSDSKSEDEFKDNRKVLVFSYYKDTAIWILNRLKEVTITDQRLSAYSEVGIALGGSPDEAEVMEPDKACGICSRDGCP